ncbi:cation efflux protein [Leucogyrophana mollusca]|uniref:Cation efflux protein n=1 Tax=Leucogyrophana mollusca TaxID=85980 RepID=A0ACB8B5B9_9AGAM|nr:cation efflux protein [Leucogyrophana mollusca]
MKPTTKLSIVLAISIAFFTTEIAIGFRTKSLALIADAFHYLNVSSFCCASSHAFFFKRKAKELTPEFSYAFHRGELVGAFFNGVFLLALALSIFLQAVERFVNVQSVDQPIFVLIVGCVGLLLNILSVLIVHDHSGHSHGHASHEEELTTLDVAALPTASSRTSSELHNLHNHVSLPIAPPQKNYGLLAVLIHLFGDAVNNVGVIVAATIMWKIKSPSRFYADPAVSMIISIIIFASALPLTKRSARILLEAAPAGLNLELVMEDLLAVPGVLSIHDLHVWQLSQSITLASFHVRVATNTDLVTWEHTEESLHQCCAAYGISHATIAPEVQHERRGGAGNARARAACDDGFGCAADDKDLFQMRKRAGRSVALH